MNSAIKTCETCGRVIEQRKKWLKDWEQIKYCSEKCRRSKNAPSYEEALLKLLHVRGVGKTICPSEILGEDQKQNKAIMERVRQSARRLVAKNKIEILQKGKTVDPSTAKGPIRLKLKTKGI
jgi:hypothetical protein